MILLVVTREARGSSGWQPKTHVDTRMDKTVAQQGFDTYSMCHTQCAADISRSNFSQ